LPLTGFNYDVHSKVISKN